MLFLTNRKILSAELGFKYHDSACRCRWWLKNRGFLKTSKKVADILTSISAHPDFRQHDVDIVKVTDKKMIFRACNADATDTSPDTEQSFVVKSFFLKKLSHRLKYHRYGIDEVANIIRAGQLGINVPKVFGYAHMYDALGMVNTNIILMQDLHPLKPIGEIMEDLPDEHRDALFMATIPLVISLYKANCNHIDVNAGGVLLQDAGQEGKAVLIDWQHARFHKTPSLEQLIFESAYFAGSCKKWLKTETIDEWLVRILNTVGVTEPAEITRVKQKFQFYFSDAGRALPRKERKKIK
ncbi:MAG TPA: hypothetical protein ENO00_05185 [Deltaproteobacteria bacterium]|nr:hypothetical protein [Deltaproteobacteria bacterium]